MIEGHKLIAGRKPSGIILRATFDPFIVVPEAAWEQCKKAILTTMQLYGFHGTVQDAGGQTDAYERWSKWWAEEMRKDIEAQEAAGKFVEVCGRECSKASCHDMCILPVDHKGHCSCRMGILPVT